MIVESLFVIGCIGHLIGGPISKALMVNKLSKPKGKRRQIKMGGRTFEVKVDDFVNEEGAISTDFAILSIEHEDRHSVVLTRAELEAASLATQLEQILENSEGLSKEQVVEVPKPLIEACGRLTEEKNRQLSRRAKVIK